MLSSTAIYFAETLSYPERPDISPTLQDLAQGPERQTFVGTSPNALMIQIWTALIAALILKYSAFGWSLSNLVAMLVFVRQGRILCGRAMPQA